MTEDFVFCRRQKSGGKTEIFFGRGVAKEALDKDMSEKYILDLEGGIHYRTVECHMFVFRFHQNAQRSDFLAPILMVTEARLNCF